MNILQKLLTIVMMVVFVFCTLLAANADDTPLKIFIATWVTLGVIYAALFFVMASKRK